VGRRVGRGRQAGAHVNACEADGGRGAEQKSSGRRVALRRSGRRLGWDRGVDDEIGLEEEAPPQP
jgi:hypothetical protein